MAEVMLPAVLLVLACYLVGSLSGSLILGRMLGVDIRKSGSGNAGGTNALRTRGWRFALVVALIDVAKGVLAALLPTASGEAALQHPGWQAAAVLVAAAGHVWPVFFGFRGGKGAATLVGGLAVIWPLALIAVLSTWLLVLFATGYVGLATVLATATLLPMAAFDGGVDPTARGLFAISAFVFIVFTHRGNLQRLRAGTENRFVKARLFSRRR